MWIPLRSAKMYALHLWVPAPRLVAEVDTGLEQLAHGDGRHGRRDLLGFGLSSACLVICRPSRRERRAPDREQHACVMTSRTTPTALSDRAQSTPRSVLVRTALWLERATAARERAGDVPRTDRRADRRRAGRPSSAGPATPSDVVVPDRSSPARARYSRATLARDRLAPPGAPKRRSSAGCAPRPPPASRWRPGSMASRSISSRPILALRTSTCQPRRCQVCRAVCLGRVAPALPIRLLRAGA